MSINSDIKWFREYSQSIPELDDIICDYLLLLYKGQYYYREDLATLPRGVTRTFMLHMEIRYIFSCHDMNLYYNVEDECAVKVSNNIHGFKFEFTRDGRIEIFFDGREYPDLIRFSYDNMTQVNVKILPLVKWLRGYECNRCR